MIASDTSSRRWIPPGERWKEIASSVCSSVISTYILFVIAGFIGIGALGGAGAPVNWAGALGFLLLAMLLGGSGIHLCWTAYQMSCGRIAALGRSFQWTVPASCSALAIFVTILAVQGWPATVSLLVAGGLLLGMIVWPFARLGQWTTMPQHKWRWRVWLVVNALTALIGLTGMGMALGVTLRRAIVGTG